MILAALSGIRGLRRSEQEVGREAWEVWEELEGVGGSFDQNILWTCMTFSVKKDREWDLKGDLSFSKGNVVSSGLAHRKVEDVEAGCRCQSSQGYSPKCCLKSGWRGVAQW